MRRSSTFSLSLARTTRRFSLIAALGIVLVLVFTATPSGLSAHGAVSATPKEAAPALAPSMGSHLLAEARASLASGHGPAAGPGGDAGTSMAYDGADGYVLLSQANVTNATWGTLAQTWTFSGGNWTQLMIPGPTNRNYAAMTYDPTDGYVVMYGGIGLGGSFGYRGYLFDTWTFVNSTWTNITKNTTLSPGPRAYALMVWDASDGYALMTVGMGQNGYNSTGNLSSAWKFVGGKWSLGSGSTTLPPFGGMAYDTADGYVLFFGGTTAFGPNNGLLNTTWKYHNGTWTQITSSVSGAPGWRASPAMDYDPNLGGVLLFGGYGYNATGAGPGYLNDTWEYRNLTWTLLSTAAGPAGREEATLVFDTVDNASILFGGVNYSSGTAFSDTWAFGGGGNGSIAAPFGASPSLGFSQAAPRLSVSPGVQDVGTAVQFSTTGVQGTAASYAYTGLPPGCASASTPSLTCTPTMVGAYRVVVVVTTATGAARSFTSVEVGAGPAIGSFTATPTLTEVGGHLELNATVSGGIPPVVYHYTGLPSGCSSSNVDPLSCVAGVAGTFTVTVTATDASGGQASLSTSFEVLPANNVSLFAITPGTVDVGQSAVIATHLTGGVSPYILVYAGLPTGCASSSSMSIRCLSSVTGVFPLTVTVTDGLGFVAGGSGVLTVHPDPVVNRVAVDRANITLGSSENFTVSAGGGTGDLSYSYSGLPAGCTGANSSTLACTPTSTGNYTVVVQVEDAVSVQAFGQVNVSIAPVPIGPSPPGNGNHGGSKGSGSSTNVNAGTADLFYLGVGVGLVALAAAAAALTYRLRIAREGQQLVADLRAEGWRPEDGGTGPEFPPRSGSGPGG